MKEKFIKWNPQKAAKTSLYQITQIMEEYRNMGYRLTLRQLYYQLVSRDIIPNSVESYNRIGNVVNKGRLAGLLDWTMIEDRVRLPSYRNHWSNKKEIIESAAHAFYLSRWEPQDYYVEVWCEKDAVSNIIQPVCYQWDVLFMANRGYSSQSAMYEAAARIREKSFNLNKNPVVLYFGDHDPSGIDMTRDIDERLGLFLYGFETSCGFVERIALNMDQIDSYKPPENPAKITDSRYRSYVKKYGRSSWELDAINPQDLEALVMNSIHRYLDLELWDEVCLQEEKEKDILFRMANDFEE